MKELAFLEDMIRSGARVCSHSGRVKPGDIFVALSGSRVDGSRYVDDAIARGAQALVVSQDADISKILDDVQICSVVSPRHVLGHLARIMNATEHNMPQVVGITGTNGKTTTVHLLEYLFSSNGVSTGIIGTVMSKWGRVIEPAAMTTPDCLTLHETVGRMAADRVRLLAMEISSHALDQERIACLPVSIGVFSNLTQDHLDYHHDMETYFAAKARLFTDPLLGCAKGVVNSDDPYGVRLLSMRSDLLSYGLNTNAWLQGIIIDSGTWGMELGMRWQGQEWSLRTDLMGRHNAYNLLACQAAGLAYGLAPDQLAVLKDAPCAPGRLERVQNRHGLNIFVDYAHTPDALEKVSSALKSMGFSRLVTVFGCGGDRDATKRSLMGAAVAKYSDIAVVTSDNPRSEDPDFIIDQIMPGLAAAAVTIREVDRRKAICMAIEALTANDALLIAGKGHEDYQIIGSEKFHFSDFEVVQEHLA